jgi:membrane protease YdiL (CAAX protease family)
MIGPILLAVSWVLLRIEGKGLGAIGVNAPGARLRQFAAGFLVAGAAAVLQQLGRSVVAGVPWQLNPSLDAALVLEHLRWNTNSVLYEELLFRGYLLYQGIRWLGRRRAVLLDAAVFGIYHWFSYGILGEPVMMGFIFLYTGAFGLMLALAFAGTKSVAAPIGLHLGWNLVTNLLFSGGPLGRAIYFPANGAAAIEVSGAGALLLEIGLPLLLIVGVSWYAIRGKPFTGSLPDNGDEEMDEAYPGRSPGEGA